MEPRNVRRTALALAGVLALAAGCGDPEPPKPAPLEVTSVGSHDLAVTALAFAGNTVASGSADRRIVFWGGRAGPELWGDWGAITVLACGKAGQLAVWSAGEGTIYGCRIEQEPRPFRFRPEGGPKATALVFSPDGAYLAVGREDGTIEVWDTSSRKVVRAQRIHDGTATGLAFGPNVRELYSAGTDGAVRRWNAVVGGAAGLAYEHEAGVVFLSVDATRRILASADASGRIVVLDLGSGRSRELRPARSAVTALAIAPDGAHVVLGDADGRVTALTVETAEANPQPDMDDGRHTGAVTALLINAAGNEVISAGADGAVRRWRFHPPLAPCRTEMGIELASDLRGELTARPGPGEPLSRDELQREVGLHFPLVESRAKDDDGRPCVRGEFNTIQDVIAGCRVEPIGEKRFRVRLEREPRPFQTSVATLTLRVPGRIVRVQGGERLSDRSARFRMDGPWEVEYEEDKS